MTFFRIAVATLALASFVPTLALADYKRIRKEADFVKLFDGRAFTFDGGAGSGVVHANGKTNGRHKSFGSYKGVWVWKNKMYCRNLIINKKETGTACMKIEADGKDVRMTYMTGDRKGQVTGLTFK